MTELDNQISELNSLPDLNPNPVVSNSIPPVLDAAFETNDTTPPPADFASERLANRSDRLNAMYARVLPKIQARKLGVDSRQPWLSNPLVEQIVKATLEELYDLDVE